MEALVAALIDAKMEAAENRLDTYVQRVERKLDALARALGKRIDYEGTEVFSEKK